MEACQPLHFLDSRCLCLHLRNCLRLAHFPAGKIHLDCVNLLFLLFFLSMSLQCLNLFIFYVQQYFLMMTHILLRIQLLLIMPSHRIRSLCDLLTPFDLEFKDLVICCDPWIWIFYFLAFFLIMKEDSLRLLLGCLLEMVYIEGMQS